MITLVEETGSTNADLAARLRSGEGWAEGTWLVARRQTAGRGRQGRAWFDGAGNFMGSTVVAMGDGGPPPASLSFVAALAVRDACSAALGDTAPLGLKWPNDVLLDGGKLSGILLEMVRGHIVVGIGVRMKNSTVSCCRSHRASHSPGMRVAITRSTRWRLFPKAMLVPWLWRTVIRWACPSSSRSTSLVSATTSRAS